MARIDSKESVFHRDSVIFVAGHQGMVGSAIVRRLKAQGFDNIITRTHSELDLTQQQAVRDFFRSQKIDYVVLAAAKVGGIHANNIFRAEFIYQNLMIQCNVIHEAFRAEVNRLLFLGSSCIYPKLAPQPMSEECLLKGPLEPTNEPYAIAKIAGIKLCESYNRQYGTRYRAVMPTNLYGPNDNFDLESSHVLPALIRKFHLGKLAFEGDWDGIAVDEATHGPIPADLLGSLVTLSRTKGHSMPEDRADVARLDSAPGILIWGTGKPKREFLHVDDMATGCLFVIEESNGQLAFLNVGTGEDLSIADLAYLISDVVGYEGNIYYDPSKPDGTSRKLLDVSRLWTAGWAPKISLREGLSGTYEWYQSGGKRKKSG